MTMSQLVLWSIDAEIEMLFLKHTRCQRHKLMQTRDLE